MGRFVCCLLSLLVHGALANEINPFKIPFDRKMEEDLSFRLQNIRWPQSLSQDASNDSDNWDYGIPMNIVQEYSHYLLHNYSWEQQINKLNQIPQFQTEIQNLTIHFIHQKSSSPNAKPLLLLHGWPGSFWECHKILPMLTEPQNYGGKIENSYHVICPSIPGYGYSSSPSMKGFDQYECALIFSQLMDRLGYSRYYLQGGDWGSVVASLQASLPENSQKILGLHLNMVPVSFPYAIGIYPLLSSLLSLLMPSFYFTPSERQLINDLPLKALQETGYFHEQSTRPLTLSYGLSDSPVGLLAWIAEKFYVWSDCSVKPFQSVHPPDDFLTNFMIYWTTNTAGQPLSLSLVSPSLDFSLNSSSSSSSLSSQPHRCDFILRCSIIIKPTKLTSLKDYQSFMFRSFPSLSLCCLDSYRCFRSPQVWPSFLMSSFLQSGIGLSFIIRRSFNGM
jgi:epoxide hydrolase